MIDSRPSNFPNIQNPGPYEAMVVSHLDSKYMGSLRVELLKSSTTGNQPERTGQIITAKYMNPFYGTTPIGANSKNDDYASTQKSYGMWFVPPDVGTRVLVIFVEGNISRAYWMGCVQDTFMNFMTPDPWAGSIYNNENQSQPLPVGEFNKKTESATGTDPTKYLKPVNKDFERVLGSQGLLRDPIRGLTTSTSRREVPSKVFGISTPGPVDKRANAPRSKVGPSEAKANVFSSRLGGSSLIFDDGDDTLLRKGFASQSPSEYANIVKDETGGFVALPFNECVRLRTRTGHQILMHNTEDLIYIGNARGSTWIELTANGKIDIFADDSISIRTSVDVNISSDRDLNFTAARDINFNAGRDYKLTVNNNSDVKIGVDHKLDVGANYDVYVGASQKNFVGATNDLVVTADHKITTRGNFDISTTGSRKDTQASFDLNSEGDNRYTAGGNTDILSTGNHTETAAEIHMNGPEAAQAEIAAGAATALVAASALWPVRVPQKEPWRGHEHLDPATFAPSKTQASVSPSPSLRETTPQVATARDQQPVSEDYKKISNVNGPQTVVPGTVGPTGTQPAKPVAVTELQRFFLNELIKAVGLNPATCLNSADPTKNPPGVPTGNAEALGMAMAQVQAECGFKPRSENLNYSASSLRRVFPTRVRSDEFAQELANAGSASIGNTIYGNRFGNAQDEGFKYRGRGLIQLTFKDNYRLYGRLANATQVIENPDLANDPIVATKLAVAYLKSKTIAWGDFELGSLGQQFRRAVGYADQGGAETNNRISIGKGFISKLINNELTPVVSIKTEPAGTNIEAGKGTAT